MCRLCPRWSCSGSRYTRTCKIRPMWQGPSEAFTFPFCELVKLCSRDSPNHPACACMACRRILGGWRCVCLNKCRVRREEGRLLKLRIFSLDKGDLPPFLVEVPIGCTVRSVKRAIVRLSDNRVRISTQSHHNYRTCDNTYGSRTSAWQIACHEGIFMLNQ